jgi:hypothetical protein
MGKTVLIDAVRVFRDGRECPVATTPTYGVALLRTLYLRRARIDELWLDHDLGGDLTIWPVVRLLEDEALAGRVWDIGVVKVHAQRSGPAYEIGVSLRRVGYRTERVADLSVFRVRDAEERLVERPTAPAPDPARARRAARTPIPDAHRLGCVSYHAGHNVHWIQALHSINKPEVAARSWTGRILGMDGDSLTVRKPDGDLVVFRNHDLERLAAIRVVEGSDTVVVNDQYAILRVGNYCFSVKRDTGRRLSRCISDPPPRDPTDGQLAAQLDSHGGFSVPVRRRPKPNGNVSATRQNGGTGGSNE